MYGLNIDKSQRKKLKWNAKKIKPCKRSQEKRNEGTKIRSDD